MEHNRIKISGEVLLEGRVVKLHCIIGRSMNIMDAGSRMGCWPNHICVDQMHLLKVDVGQVLSRFQVND